MEIEHAHSEVGPSSGERWIRCAASVLASRGKDDRASKYAAEGTFYHEVSLWTREQSVPATTFIGREGVVDGYVFKVTKAGALAVQQFVDWCAEVPGDPYWEVRVAYEQWVPGGFGTADDIRIADGLCTVTDLKFGEGIRVHAKENEQLLLYGLGVYATYNWLYEFDRFDLRIAQPRRQHFDTWSTTLAEVLWWADTVATPAAQRALTPGGGFSAGSWCQFCRIKKECLVYSAYRRERDANSPSREKDFDDLDALEKSEILIP